MTHQQRNEYIAEKMLGFIRQITHSGQIVWKVPIHYQNLAHSWNYIESFPDFLSLSEWTGPICEVVFPILAKEWISIHFCESEKGEEPMFYLDDGSTDPMISLDRYMGPFPLREFTQRIVDAHIKITGEKGE
jgi:hypothetical protein